MTISQWLAVITGPSMMYKHSTHLVRLQPGIFLCCINLSCQVFSTTMVGILAMKIQWITWYSMVTFAYNSLIHCCNSSTGERLLLGGILCWGVTLTWVFSMWLLAVGLNKGVWSSENIGALVLLFDIDCGLEWLVTIDRFFLDLDWSIHLDWLADNDRYLDWSSDDDRPSRLDRSFDANLDDVKTGFDILL